jgi:hypothetical protein
VLPESIHSDDSCMVPSCEEIALWAISFTTRGGRVGLILCRSHRHRLETSCSRRVDVENVQARRRLDPLRLDWLRARWADQRITIPIKPALRDREV